MRRVFAHPRHARTEHSPMALPPDLDLNGYLFSHASVDARIYGIRTKGLKELAYKTSVEDAEGRGTAREALGVTVGDVKYEASATVLSPGSSSTSTNCISTP